MSEWYVCFFVFPYSQVKDDRTTYSCYSMWVRVCDDSYSLVPSSRKTMHFGCFAFLVSSDQLNSGKLAKSNLWFFLIKKL